MVQSQETNARTDEFQVQSFPKDTIQSIRICCKVSHINVVGSLGTDVRIVWKDTHLRKMDIHMQDGMLEVKERDRVAIYEIFGLLELSRDKELLLEVPVNFLGNILLDAFAETVECKGVDMAGKLTVHTRTGAVNLHNMKAAMISVNADHGRIQATRITVENGIVMSSTNGEIICNICGDSNEFITHCHSRHGRCRIPESSSQGLKTLQLDSMTGNITVSFAG